MYFIKQLNDVDITRVDTFSISVIASVSFVMVNIMDQFGFQKKCCSMNFTCRITHI